MRLQQTRPSSPPGRPGVRVRSRVGPRTRARRGKARGRPQWRGPWVCPLLAPSRRPRIVRSPHAGAGQDPLGTRGTDFEARYKGGPTLGPFSFAPTSQARTLPVTARPTAWRPPPRAWGSIGLHRGYRWEGGNRGAQGPRTLRALDCLLQTGGELRREPRGAGPGPSRSPPWGRLCASRGRWGRGRAREGAGGGPRCPPSIWWRHFLPPPPRASQAGNWLRPIGRTQRPPFCWPW